MPLLLTSKHHRGCRVCMMGDLGSFEDAAWKKGHHVNGHSKPEDEFAHIRDDIGQLARLKTYTHLLCCFPLSDDQKPETITRTLEEAARKLTASFPWLTAQVVHGGAEPGNSGTFKLLPCSSFTGASTAIRTKDCRALCPSYADILAAKGTQSMLDGSILGPVKAFPETYEESPSNPAPVLIIQANYIKGGLLLDAAAQHNFVDGSGLFQAMRLFAKALRGESFTATELEQGNRDRRNLIPLLGADEPLLDHSHLLREPIPATNGAPPPPNPTNAAAWHTFRFPASALASIKSRANSTLPPSTSSNEEDVPFVSTNDALNAFIWQRLSATRLARHKQPDRPSKCSRALDARRAMGVPGEYMGQMGYNATCTLTFGDVAEQFSLGKLAAALRRTVAAVNNPLSVRSWVTFIAREPDKSRIMFGGKFDPDNDVGLSSLVHAELHSVEFGALGKPQLVRRPNFKPLQGCVYLWNRTEEGDWDVLMCLSRTDLEALRGDGEWGESTEYIG